MKHKQNFGQQDVASLKTSSESRLYWRNFFEKLNYFLEILQFLKLIRKPNNIL